MLAFLLLQAAVPQTAVDAERAFARAAQAKGQWTAFREFAAEDATMFVPQPVKAQDWLRGRKNPDKSVEWSPAESYVSCDGKTAVNTGPWVRPGSVGYFTTVWHRQASGGWKWSIDHGDTLPTPRALPEKPKLVRAACTGKPAAIGFAGGGKQGRGVSPDGTLIYRWQVADDGGRLFAAHLWTSTGWVTVVRDLVPRPRAK